MPNFDLHALLSLPIEERGQRLLKLPEDQWFDRKGPRVSKQAVANHIVGFANAEGGTLVVGLENGAVTGTDADPRHRNDLTQAAVDLTIPPARVRHHLVECVRDDGHRDRLLLLEIEPSTVVHANNRDEAFLRIVDETRKLTFQQRQELLFDKGQASFDGSVITGSGWDDLDAELAEEYAAAMGGVAAERLFRARGLLAPTGELTAAGYLLFGRFPQDRFPEAYVRVLRYRGTERGTGRRQDLVADVRCEGPIPRLLRESAQVVRELEPARRVLRKGSFVREGLIPEDAWLEGIVNAVVHRSYSLGGDHIRVEVFNDRIEVHSPGSFPGVVRLADPLHVARFARNPRIARVCADLDFGQELGEGIRRMFEEMRAAGLLDPLYQQAPGHVRLSLAATAVTMEDAARLPSRAREAMEVIRQAGGIGTGDLADALGLSRPAAIKRLRALEQAGLIEWVGKTPKDPRAYWRLTSE
ncbi:MAG TPA: ATP-binding protein [Acidimicrobiales bacterium]|nr:ATP-binding protein [Acidimicrobiales bacterium]